MKTTRVTIYDLAWMASAAATYCEEQARNFARMREAAMNDEVQRVLCERLGAQFQRQAEEANALHEAIYAHEEVRIDGDIIYVMQEGA